MGCDRGGGRRLISPIQGRLLLGADQPRHHHTVEHRLGRAGHEQMAIGLIPLDVQRAAGQIEAGAALAQAQQMAGHQRGAGAGATGQGGASAPLPHPHHQMGWLQHLHEVHVGAGREHGMALQGRPQQLEIDRLDIRHRNHDVGIPHADGCHGQNLASDGQIPLG